MKTTLVLAALGVATMFGTAPEAQARGCIRGAVVGGIAGHAAGHGVLGAAGGCLVGRHLANRSAQQPPPQQQQAPAQGNPQ